jgi:hypothetical protein
MTDKLNEVFNLEPSPERKLIREVDGDDTQSDYELARKTLREVIVKGTNALDDIMMLARSSEHPRSYEVAGQIMKTMSDVSKDLLALQKQKQDLEKPAADTVPQIAQQNNILFAGSTNDLLQMIRQQQVKTIDSSDTNS